MVLPPYESVGAELRKLPALVRLVLLKLVALVAVAVAVTVLMTQRLS